MRKFSKLVSVLLAALMVFAMLAGCAKDETTDAPTGGETDGTLTGNETAGGENTAAGADDGQTQQGSETEGGTAPSGDSTQSDTPAVDTAPKFDGVYANDVGMIVIRDADAEMCEIIVSIGPDGAEAYVSGIAQIVDNTVLYQTESYAMTMTVSFDELTVTEEGVNLYYAHGFAGSYTRTETDPYSIEARPTAAVTQGPETTGYTMINGAKAILYIDSLDRFTATVPDIFSDRPEDKQPETGIYFGSIDNDVYALIEVTGDGGIEAEQLKADMESDYGVEADLFVNGMVTVTYTYEQDGEEWIGHIYACVIEDRLVRIEYCYIAAQDAYYSTHLDQISINFS